jgi:hypothetical protein
MFNRRPPAGPLWLRPPAADELSMPAQQRLRRHDQPLPIPRRERPAERGEEGAIGCSKRRPRLLPAKHQQLMAQNEQLDVLGELVAAATDEQPQQCREREIRERKEHPPMPPEPARVGVETRNLVLEPLTLESDARASALDSPARVCSK